MSAKIKPSNLQFLIDTMNHITNVRTNIFKFVSKLNERGATHDSSKLYDPEASLFATVYNTLNAEPGTVEETEQMYALKEALTIHQLNNRHHPEYFKYGIEDMNLIDIVEMVCNWIAIAKEKNLDIYAELKRYRKQYQLSDQLYNIIRNTFFELR